MPWADTPKATALLKIWSPSRLSNPLLTSLLPHFYTP